MCMQVGIYECMHIFMYDLMDQLLTYIPTRNVWRQCYVIKVDLEFTLFTFGITVNLEADP